MYFFRYGFFESFIDRFIQTAIKGHFGSKIWIKELLLILLFMFIFLSFKIKRLLSNFCEIFPDIELILGKFYFRRNLLRKILI